MRFLKARLMRHLVLLLLFLMLSLGLFFLNIDFRLLIPEIPLHLVLHHSVLNSWLNILQICWLDSLALAAGISLMHVVLRGSPKVKLFLWIVRRVRLRRTWSVSWNIVWVCCYNHVSWVVTDWESNWGRSLCQSLGTFLQVSMLGRGMLNQDTSFVLPISRTHILLVSLNVRGIAYLICLTASWLINRWCTLTIWSTTPVFYTTHRLIISASILRVQILLISLLFLLEMRMVVDSVLLFLGLIVGSFVIFSEHLFKLSSCFFSLD